MAVVVLVLSRRRRRTARNVLRQPAIQLEVCSTYTLIRRADVPPLPKLPGTCLVLQERQPHITAAAITTATRKKRTTAQMAQFAFTTCFAFT